MNMGSSSGLFMLAFFLMFALAACEQGRSSDANLDAPEWWLDYDGDLSGRIEGKSIVVVRGGPPAHLNIAVRTIGKNPGLTASLSVHDGKAHGHLMGVTLGDGTRCKPVNRSDVEIIDTEKETFHATIEGQMKCGEAEDRIIDFEAVIRKR